MSDARAGSRDMGGAPVFTVKFARTHPIELDDAEVEFATRLGARPIRKKLKLKEMFFQGRLAL
ncbi:MAG: hypothetical protein IPP47_19520 [Bryobacterales bacterium]|nr:hypothetical protein [Bryobacterales bacterium]